MISSRSAIFHPGSSAASDPVKVAQYYTWNLDELELAGKERSLLRRYPWVFQGSVGSGKSNFLAAMTWELRRILAKLAPQ